MDIVKVVEHHVKALPRVAFAQLAERLADFLDPTAGTEDAVQVIVVDIVKPEEVLDAVGTAIGSPHAYGAAPARPSHAARRADLQRPPLVEADYDSTRRTGPIELADEFF